MTIQLDEIEDLHLSSMDDFYSEQKKELEKAFVAYYEEFASLFYGDDHKSASPKFQEFLAGKKESLIVSIVLKAPKKINQSCMRVLPEGFTTSPIESFKVPGFWPYGLPDRFGGSASSQARIREFCGIRTQVVHEKLKKDPEYKEIMGLVRTAVHNDSEEGVVVRIRQSSEITAPLLFLYEWPAMRQALHFFNLDRIFSAQKDPIPHPDIRAIEQYLGPRIQGMDDLYRRMYEKRIALSVETLSPSLQSCPYLGDPMRATTEAYTQLYRAPLISHVLRKVQLYLREDLYKLLSRKEEDPRAPLKEEKLAFACYAVLNLFPDYGFYAAFQQAFAPFLPYMIQATPFGVQDFHKGLDQNVCDDYMKRSEALDTISNIIQALPDGYVSLGQAEGFISESMIQLSEIAKSNLAVQIHDLTDSLLQQVPESTVLESAQKLIEDDDKIRELAELVTQLQDFAQQDWAQFPKDTQLTLSHYESLSTEAGKALERLTEKIQTHQAHAERAQKALNEGDNQRSMLACAEELTHTIRRANEELDEAFIQALGALNEVSALIEAHQQHVREEAQQLENAEQKAEDTEDPHSTYEQLVDQAARDLDAMRAERDALLLENKGLSRDNYRISAQMEALSGRFDGTSSPLFDRQALSETIRTLVQQGISCHQVLASFASLYPDRIEVLESAYSSAADNEDLIPVTGLADRLEQLATSGIDAVREANGQISVLREQMVGGISLQESKTVERDEHLRKHREFEVDGKKRFFAPHLKLSYKGRLHFDYDAQRDKILIAYCGKHLPSAKHRT